MNGQGKNIPVAAKPPVIEAFVAGFIGIAACLSALFGVVYGWMWLAGIDCPRMAAWIYLAVTLALSLMNGASWAASGFSAEDLSRQAWKDQKRTMGFTTERRPVQGRSDPGSSSSTDVSPGGSSDGDQT